MPPRVRIIENGSGLDSLDEAAKLLVDAGEPVNTKTMIEAMAAKNLWTGPGGATPWATLYSAIALEINEKGATPGS